MGKDKEICSIEWNYTNLAQLLFIQGVVLPQIIGILDEYADDLAELGGVEC